MDLDVLSIRLEKDANSYKEEYEKALLAYESMIDLPMENASRLKYFINFLSQYMFKISSNFPSIIVKHLKKTKNFEIHNEIMRIITFLYHKKMVDCVEFFYLYLEYSSKLEIKIATLCNDLDSLNLFIHYFEKGNDRQKCFCLLMIAFLYESFNFQDEIRKHKHKSSIKQNFLDKEFKNIFAEIKLDPEISKEIMHKCEEIIISNLFTTPKLVKISVLYFLSEIDFCKDDVSKIVENIKFKSAEKLCRQLIRSIKTKEDNREIRIQKYKIVSVLKNQYNLSIQTAFDLLKLINFAENDLRDILKIVVDSVDEKDVYEVVDNILDRFCAEYKEDAVIAYGFNILRELAKKLNISEYLSDKIDMKLGKSKCVFYARKSLIKVIKGKESVKEDIDHIKKKATKEEKIAKAKRSEKSFFRKKGKRRKASKKKLKTQNNRKLR